MQWLIFPQEDSENERPQTLKYHVSFRPSPNSKIPASCEFKVNTDQALISPISEKDSTENFESELVLFESGEQVNWSELLFHFCMHNLSFFSIRATDTFPPLFGGFPQPILRKLPRKIGLLSFLQLRLRRLPNNRIVGNACYTFGFSYSPLPWIIDPALEGGYVNARGCQEHLI